MKLATLILMLCAGCAATPVAPVPAPPIPQAIPRAFALADIIEPPPAPVAIVLHFTYPRAPLTNGSLMQSDDLKTWFQAIYTLTTNDDHIDWWVTNDFSKPAEFFRAGGETIQ